MNKPSLFAMVFPLAATAIGVSAVSAAGSPVHTPEREAGLLSAFSSLKDHVEGPLRVVHSGKRGQVRENGNDSKTARSLICRILTSLLPIGIMAIMINQAAKSSS